MASLSAGTVARANPTDRLTQRDQYVTIALGLWLMGGLLVDGWAHENLRQLEGFFTPWHGLFYSGYAASTARLIWLIWRGRRAGRVGLATLPRGYELGLVGTVLFGLGGVGDMAWHLAFGIERDRAALLSPTHLLLFAGMTLIVTSPFRAAWASPDRADVAPSLARFLPALLSLTAATAFAGFFNGYLWALIINHHHPATIVAYAQSESARALLGLSRDLDLAAILLSNLLLLAPVLLLLRRWRPPFGSVTLLWGALAAMGSAVVAFRFAEYLAVGLVAGLAADGLIRALRPCPARVRATHAFAALAPLVFWGLYFLVTRLRGGEGWSPELWVGITVMAALSGVGLSVLMSPPTLPDSAQASAEPGA